MATLTDSGSGESCLLRVHHVFGRDAARCDTVIPDHYISRVHACIRFNGGCWELHDQSSNGTLLSGKLLRNGEYAVLAEGDVIHFGQAGGAGWQVADLADPVDMLWPVRAPARPVALDSAHVLGSVAGATVTIVRSSMGEWLCDDRGAPRVLHHGDLVTAGNLSWHLMLARSDLTQALVTPTSRAAPAQRIEFAVSQDEEHVRAALHTRGGIVDLGERAHHYCLATLARVRFADVQAGYDSASQGWLDMDALARMLGIDVPHVNVHIHRARAQFGALPGTATAGFVERRRGGVRFGAVAFRVFRGEQLECQWLPADAANGVQTLPAPGETMRRALPT
jgi:hypothetical protein